MFEALIITLREGIEAALVVGIILIYLKKTEREASSRWVYAGLAAGLTGGLVFAAIVASIGISEEVYEGWLMILGSIFVAGMVLWMMRTARSLKGDIEHRLERISARPAGRAVAAGLFGLTFVLILREAVETVLFLAAAVDLTTDAMLAFIGGLVGIVLAVLFGISFVRGTMPIDLGRFFKVTSIVLILLAVQLLIGGIHEFGERGTLPIGRRAMMLIGPIVKNDVLIVLSLLALPLIFLLVPGRATRTRAQKAEALEGPARRLAVSKVRRERLWRTAFAAAGIVVLASLTVSYAYSRLPREIDPPRILDAQETRVHVPKQGLDDGHLHRFGVPVRGTVVRFFVIKSGTSVVPAFDACQVCGAYGYIETRGHLVCLACAADVNAATIGVGGGCNPIPLPHRDAGDEIVIDIRDLETMVPVFQEAGREPSPPGAG